MSLVLNLTKPGEAGEKISLNLTKGEQFTAVIEWSGDVDLDSHALLCINHGQGGKVSGLEDILSTYNIKRKIRGQEVGILVPEADGSFSIHNGALTHTADVTGGDDQKEVIVINPSKLPETETFEIPLLAMIHPQHGGSEFKDVPTASVYILDSDGKEVMRASLSDEFGPFVGVQMGSIIIDSTGTHFERVAVGFNEDFNGVLGYFS